MRTLEKYKSAEIKRIKSNERALNDSYYYTERKNNTVIDNMIMYEAFFGRGMLCNPFALFKYILSQEQFRSYVHIWSVEDNPINRKIKEEYQRYPNVIFVEPETEEYFTYLTKAKYLITNTTFKNYFSKKEGQIIVNTWHGIPLKKMGYDDADGVIKSANIIRNFFMTDYLLSESDYTTQLFSNAYKLDNLFEGKIIETGSPRIDLLIHSDIDEVEALLSKAGVKIDRSKKIALYAPTFRGDYANPVIDDKEIEDLLERMEEYLGSEYQVLFKPHQIVYEHMVKRGICKDSYISSTVDINVIMSATDLLITDYSSTFFDYLVTDRDIVFYVPDFEEYQEERGVYFALNEMPGPVCRDLNELKEVLRDPESISERFDRENYLYFRNIMVNEDGEVCKRVVEAVFSDNREHIITKEKTKPRILFHTDVILKNGISSSASNLLNLINTEKYDVTFIAIGNRDLVRTYTDNLPAGIRVLYRDRGLVGNAEDIARKDYCMDNAIVLSDGNDLYPAYLYETEYKRSFGDAHFDCIINFSGFSAYQTNILLSNKDAFHIIWMHSVMKREYNRMANGERVFERSLNNLFKIYDKFGAVISCSQTAMHQNRSDLATDETYSRFDFINNTVDKGRVERGLAHEVTEVQFKGRKYITLARDKEQYTCIRKPEKSDHNFVTMGRLSEEKNYAALINAFKRLHNENRDTKLYIIGDGPLNEELTDMVFSSGLGDSVTITGNLENPFMVMKECDCFVLPSLYEGLPMVIPEARLLGLSIIMSDFSTVADSSIPGGQLIVSKSEEGIYEGLKEFCNGNVTNDYRFDADEYNDGILSKLYTIIDEGIKVHAC